MNEMSAAREEKGRAWCTGWFSQHVAGRKGVENEERREKCSKKAEGRVDDSCTEQDGRGTPEAHTPTSHRQGGRNVATMGLPPTIPSTYPANLSLILDQK